MAGFAYMDMDVDQLDRYMISFEPYRKGTNPNHTFENGSKTLSYLKIGYLDSPNYAVLKETFCTNILLWLKREVSSLIDPVIIVIAPGHAANPNPAGFMHDIVGYLLADGNINVQKQLLIRTQTVPKQAQSAGLRNEDTHRGTIEIQGSPIIPDNSGKVVIILDDVWTSGSTLRVCKEVMLKTNPKEVKLFAIGKTV